MGEENWTSHCRSGVGCFRMSSHVACYDARFRRHGKRAFAPIFAMFANDFTLHELVFLGSCQKVLGKADQSGKLTRGSSDLGTIEMYSHSRS